MPQYKVGQNVWAVRESEKAIVYEGKITRIFRKPFAVTKSTVIELDHFELFTIGELFNHSPIRTTTTYPNGRTVTEYS